MGSTRFPGKILREAAGKPLLQWQIERINSSKKIDSIIIATSEEQQDNVVQTLCEDIGVPCFRGSEEDVLDRFYKAALPSKAEHIVRLTGDCPLIDYRICDRLIERHLSENSDYACLADNFAEGLDCEVMTFKALKDAWENARMASEREHVTLYIRNSGLFKCTKLCNLTDDSAYRITVDEHEDFVVVEKIFNMLDHPENDGFKNIKILLDANPDIIKINSKIIRNEGLIKSLNNDHIMR